MTSGHGSCEGRCYGYSPLDRTRTRGAGSVAPFPGLPGASPRPSAALAGAGLPRGRGRGPLGCQPADGVQLGRPLPRARRLGPARPFDRRAPIGSPAHRQGGHRSLGRCRHRGVSPGPRAPLGHLDGAAAVPVPAEGPSDRGLAADGRSGDRPPRPALEAAAAPVGPPPGYLAPGKRGLKRGLRGRLRTVRLMLDEVIITETPPLYAVYGYAGEQVRVPITGNRGKRILHGAINVGSGDIELLITQEWTQQTHQTFLSQVRLHWQGWNPVLFEDRASQHKAPASR